MSRDDKADQIVEALRALIAAVQFDDSGVNGRGGNGGLLSPETRKVADNGSLLIDAWDRWWRDSSKDAAQSRPLAPVDVDEKH